MARELVGAYEPKTVEDEIYQRWEKSGFFQLEKIGPAGAMLLRADPGLRLG